MTEETNPPNGNENVEAIDNGVEALDLKGKMYFHMILADVVFATAKGGITSHRTQFITQSPTNEFPADRIYQLQNSAAATVRNKLASKEASSFHVHDVLFLAITPCGQMSTEEFYGPGQTAEAIVTEKAVAPSPVAPAETGKSDNSVLPFDRKS